VILITTSDYYPQIGGLTSFTDNIIKALKNINCQYELFHWKNFREIESYDESQFEKYDLIINIHPMFSWLKKSGHEKMINFIHGSEILMTSPNLIKKIIKNLNKEKYFKKLESVKYNFFISEFTKIKIESLGFKVDYSRDIIFHNCIDVSDAKIKTFDVKDEIRLVCIARDVPHKNIAGVVRLSEMMADITKRKVHLTLSPGINLRSTKIKIENLNDFTDQTRSKAYSNSDFNILLSKDHSTLGFFEGFGLTTMEAAIYGTPSIVLKSGGLPESIHHQLNGIVIEQISASEVELIVSFLESKKYQALAEQAFEHVKNNHSLVFYEKLLNRIMEK
jgi:glycosyltransferase involved in cell wall biosynthesis